jgi:signal transduction histidine kinase
LTLIAATMLVFGVPGSRWEIASAREYILFPPLIWAALRFSVRGVVTSVALVMIVAVAQTSVGRGPFVWTYLHQSLFELQAFMGICGATFLLLGASISERRRAARDLQLARETAETANRAKAQFLAVVSHELRTPLNAITGYVDLLTLELDGPLTEKQRAALERISSSQRHLLALIEDVLGFAQVEAGRLTILLQSVDVATALSSVEPLVAPEMKRRQLTLEVASVEPGLCVQADPHRLRQILLNLVTNAMKFTAPGGRISLAASATEGRVRITVTDTGIGISAEHLPRVFEPFYQVDQGGTRRYPGLGLGLSIVRDAVLAMNGDVSIDSETGRGTTVTLTLPR